MYPERVEYDLSQPAGQRRKEVAVTDAWVLANKRNTLLLTADKTTITAADPPVDFATITVQLQTPMLTDGSHDDVAVSGPVSVVVNGKTAMIALDENGAGAFQVDSIEPGSFEIRGAIGSNIITMEAV